MTGARLAQGSDAVAEAAIAAGCTFFAGYPMLPFTDLLESMARRMPVAGGVCMNAETEIEAANMALGAAAAGARAATGSCGQGIALMQEAIAEAALNEVPVVVFNMARGQQDYFQATRGGGWGDYRTICLAPKDVREAVEHTQLLFHLADKYRAPTILYGDYLISHTYMSVDISPLEFAPLPPKEWALDGTRGGTGASRQIWTWAMGKANDPGPGPDLHWRRIAEKFEAAAEQEQRWESSWCEDASAVVVSFGTAGPFIEQVVAELRDEGIAVGSFRPITLWPFPERALSDACQRAKKVLVFEVNAGQMVDDVRLAVGGRVAVERLGRVSIDFSGMRQGEILTLGWIRQRVRAALDLEPVSA